MITKAKVLACLSAVLLIIVVAYLNQATKTPEDRANEFEKTAADYTQRAFEAVKKGENARAEHLTASATIWLNKAKDERSQIAATQPK